MYFRLTDEEIIDPEDISSTFKYIFKKNVYDCILYEGDVWLSGQALSGILSEPYEKIFTSVSELSDKEIVGKKAHRYFFRDGNRQSYMSDQANYFNVDACIALSVYFAKYELLDYISWTRHIQQHNASGQYMFGAIKQKKKDFSYYSCNTFSHIKYDVVVPHKHNCFELVYYVNGAGITSSEEGSFEYKEDSIFLVKPGTIHEEYITEDSECICLIFYTEIDLPVCFIEKTAKNQQEIATIREYLSELRELKSPEGQHERENIVLLIVYMLQKIINNNKKENKFSDETVEYVKKYIESNYQCKINFNILSERIGYSLSRLNVLFRNKEGRPIYAYLSDIRLLKAKEYLRKGNDFLGTIAKKCGFGSESRFSQFFKEKTGVSPQVYRKISRKETMNGVLHSNSKMKQ